MMGGASGGSGGRVWEGVGDDGSGGSGGSSGSGGVNYVLWLGGGVFDFIAGLIHSLSDAALL